MAEAVFASLVRERGLEDHFDVIDSAGTAGYHVGDAPDSRSVATCKGHGIPVRHRGQKVSVGDFSKFDYMLCMDDSNLSNLKRIQPKTSKATVSTSLVSLPMVNLIYIYPSGDMDLICNWFGLRDMVDNMSWNGATGMNNVSAQNWYIDGTLQGWYKTARNLTFVLKYNASHMMPVDSPEASTDMLNRFIGAVDPLEKHVGSLVVDTPVISADFFNDVEITTKAATTIVSDVGKMFAEPQLDELENINVGNSSNYGSVSTAYGSFALFLLVLVIGAILVSFLRKWQKSGGSFPGLLSVIRGAKSHEWMELDTVSDGNDLMDDDELNEILELESGGVFAPRRHVGAS
ncbi:hypothetical protein HK100_009542 [Physocladia obscura]|uniref:Phosphotyrosine protein phosphatase I domain-containing protein n=1 Tax=Physocladia obscura TaxID=109957 RepID=A0AAD5T387_9FUNG|nr:hypothetical protein HK100_009542 [Physocladia obscura]